MSAPDTARWIRLGLLALPVYGLLTFWSTLAPGQTKDPEAWARFVGSTSYLVDHMLGAIGGAILAILGLAILLMFFGNVLLGVAVWRSETLPRWAGAIWVASALLFYVLGAVLGMVTTGSSLLTQPVGGLLLAIGGGWIALSALRRPSAEVAGAGARPRVQ